MTLKAKGEIRRMKAVTTKIAAMGRVRKINGLPPEMIRDCRKAFSNMAPKHLSPSDLPNHLIYIRAGRLGNSRRCQALEYELILAKDDCPPFSGPEIEGPKKSGNIILVFAGVIEGAYSGKEFASRQS
jgi:hypothetical protein